MKRILTDLILCIGFVLAGCGASQPEAPAFFTAAEWNVQALFDGEEAGNEYGEFRESAGWTAEKYRARLTTISKAIPLMTGKDSAPDLIGFVEIENSGVLEDLAKGELSKHGYGWIAFTRRPGSSLGIGFLSRYPLLDVRSHSITVEKASAPRPVLEARVEPGGKPLVFLLCHWKSKLGGEDATEAQRRSSARVVQRRLRELKESEPETPVIIMGDLNENHDEFYRRTVFSALLPDDPDAAALAAQGTTEPAGTRGFLVLSREKPPVASFFPEDVPALYSPWEAELSDGTFFYKGEWETIDHLLLSEELFSGSGWNFAGCKVVSHAPFTTSKGVPGAYNPKNGNGLSDHLPLLLYLEYHN